MLNYFLWHVLKQLLLKFCHSDGPRQWHVQQNAGSIENGRLILHVHKKCHWHTMLSISSTDSGTFNLPSESDAVQMVDADQNLGQGNVHEHDTEATHEQHQQ